MVVEKHVWPSKRSNLNFIEHLMHEFESTLCAVTISVSSAVFMDDYNTSKKVITPISTEYYGLVKSDGIENPYSCHPVFPRACRYPRCRHLETIHLLFRFMAQFRKWQLMAILFIFVLRHYKPAMTKSMIHYKPAMTNKPKDNNTKTTII